MKTIDDKMRVELMNLLRRQVRVLINAGEHHAATLTQKMHTRLRRHFESQDPRTPVVEMVEAAVDDDPWADDGWDSKDRPARKKKAR